MLRPRPVLWRMRDEWRNFVRVNPSDRPWQLPFAIALATCLPLLVGVAFGRVDYGVLSSMAGFVFLYLPETVLQHRMMWVMTCGFGLIGSFALGLFAHFFPMLLVPFLIMVTILSSMLCRFYGFPLPGGVIFVMVAAVGAYSPTATEDIPLKVGLFAMGALLATLVAFIYSVVILRTRKPVPTPETITDFNTVIMEPLVIGLFVGLSIALAQIYQLNRPYWVPVSCLAVIQGVSLRAVWTRQLHRILGTFVGLGVAWALLMLPLNAWTITLTLTALSFIVHSLVVRHYGIAMVFITPLSILMAQVTILGHGAPNEVFIARMTDTVLGSMVGFIGGAILHNARLRRNLRPMLERLWPVCFGPHETVRPTVETA
jgi:hypothetical protein